VAKILPYTPGVLLLFVACVQIYLAQTANLSPWKGGGFGMFSTTDGISNRSLRVYVNGPQRSEEILLEGKLQDLAARAQLFPGNLQLEKLAREIFRDQQSKKLPIDDVSIEVWRTEYAKNDLYPTRHLVRKFVSR